MLLVTDMKRQSVASMGMRKSKKQAKLENNIRYGC